MVVQRLARPVGKLFQAVDPAAYQAKLNASSRRTISSSRNSSAISLCSRGMLAHRQRHFERRNVARMQVRTQLPVACAEGSFLSRA